MPWLSTDPRVFPGEMVERANQEAAQMRLAFDILPANAGPATSKQLDLGSFVAIHTVDRAEIEFMLDPSGLSVQILGLSRATS